LGKRGGGERGGREKVGEGKRRLSVLNSPLERGRCPLGGAS